MDKAEAIERLEYLKAKAQIALEQEMPEWVAEDILGTIEAYDMAIEALRKDEPNSSEIPNNCEDADIFEYCPRCGMRILVDKDINVRSKDEPQTETKMETQNSNKNSNVISVYDGVSEAVRCAMCSNPNKSDRGCDGACSYDEKLYKRIMDAIDESRVKDEPQKWETPPKFEHKGITTTCVSVPACLLEIEDEPQTDCPWK